MLANYHPYKTYQIDSAWQQHGKNKQLDRDWTETYRLQSLSTQFIFTFWKMESKRKYELVLISFESDSYHALEDWDDEFDYILATENTNTYMFEHFQKEIQEEWDKVADGHIVKKFNEPEELFPFLQRWQQKILDSVEERYKKERTILEEAKAKAQIK